MLTLAYILTAIIGILLNLYLLDKIFDDLPEHGMGMGILLLPCTIPYLMIPIYLVYFITKIINRR